MATNPTLPVGYHRHNSTLKTYKPLARGASTLLRSPLAKRSVNRKAEDKARARCMRIVAKRSGGRCELRVPGVCTGVAVDGHELITRGRGGDAADPANVRHACRACHDWTHDHTTEATAMGLLISAYPGRRVEGGAA